MHTTVIPSLAARPAQPTPTGQPLALQSSLPRPAPLAPWAPASATVATWPSTTPTARCRAVCSTARPTTTSTPRVRRPGSSRFLLLHSPCCLPAPLELGDGGLLTWIPGSSFCQFHHPPCREDLPGLPCGRQHVRQQPRPQVHLPAGHLLVCPGGPGAGPVRQLRSLRNHQRGGRHGRQRLR
jgi:hypothetical protein